MVEVFPWVHKKVTKEVRMDFRGGNGFSGGGGVSTRIVEGFPGGREGRFQGA